MATNKGGNGSDRNRVSGVILLPPEGSGRHQVRNLLAQAQVRRALASIDAVHTIGPTSAIPVRAVVREVEFGGRYFYNRNSGRPTGIELNSATAVPESTLLHEVGHFIDHRTLGVPGRFASRGHPDLEPWRQVVQRTGSWETLVRSQTGLANPRPRAAIDIPLAVH